MSDRLICIAKYPSSGLASIAAGRLEAEGIRACLEGDAAAEMLWQMGPAISGVRLMVFEEQADKAVAILEAAQESADEARLYDDDTTAELADDEESDAKSDRESDDDPAWLTQRGEVITRAWRAAIIGTGLVMCVPLFSGYSLYLLCRHGLLSEQPGAPPDWRINATLMLNLAVFAGWSLMTLAFFRMMSPY